MSPPDGRRPVVLAAHGLTKSFGGETVVDRVSFEVREGTVTCVVGPSGSGKSTLLRCVNLLETPTSGYVTLDGDPIGRRRHHGRWHELPPRRVARQRRAIGMVFQGFHLFPHLTALGNVVEGPVHVGRLSRAVAERRALELLDAVGMADRRDAYPRRLSGGEQQRVAIARALAMEPRLIMLDEPTSALDPELVGEVLEVMVRLAAGGTTMLVVTHEIAFARRVADDVIVLDHGAVIESGPAARVLDTPAEPRTRAFLRNVL